MELEKQVVSLELAKRLKELWVKQESYAFWCGYQPENILSRDETLKIIDTRDNGEREWSLSTAQRNENPALRERYSAFTVAELGEMLPTYNFEYPYSFKMSGGTEWSACWISAQTQRIIHQVIAPTEADARAKMLIYLLENNLMELPK